MSYRFIVGVSNIIDLEELNAGGGWRSLAEP
jgi:hypothetical protein